MLGPPRVAACTVFEVLTKLTLHSTVPTGVWLICIALLMPGKRSYVNALGSPPLDDAPVILNETICMPPAPLLVDASLALKDVLYYYDYVPDAATTEVATGCYYIGEEDDKDFASSADIAALEERFARSDTDHDLVILGSIPIEKHISVLEMVSLLLPPWLSLTPAWQISRPPSALPNLPY